MREPQAGGEPISQIMEGDGEAWSWPEGRVTQPHEQVKGETGKGQGVVPDKVTVSWWRSFFRKWSDLICFSFSTMTSLLVCLMMWTVRG